MLLYILRHGTAEPRRPELDDAARALIDKGREQCKRAAGLLRRLELPEVVVTSPLLRARQTAEEVMRNLKLQGAPRELPTLIPGTPVEEAAAAVASAGERCVLAVGHEPLLSEMVALLCGPGLRLDLKKGGLVEVELESRKPPRGTLLGVVRPGYLRDED
jgi:phosphohistidine phosphatase